MATLDSSVVPAGIELRMAALAKAYELKQLLEKLVEFPEYGEGSCPEAALWPIEDVIGYLIPDPEEDGDPDARLRLVGGTETRP